jgi:hypothetical protein
MSSTTSPTALQSLLAKIEQAASEGDDPLVVFDLDGTLYDNTHRTLRILLEFAHTHASTHRTLYDRLRDTPPSRLQYRVDDTLAALGFSDPSLSELVVAWWKERFFTDDYCLYDLPLAGAVELVERVYRAGGVPCYLTGRDAPNMLVGTLKALQRDGFPAGRADTRLILKPVFDMDDNAFKEGVIGHLRKTGRVVGSFDNEPGLCNLFKASFPDATVVWMNTGHAPGAPTLRHDVSSIVDFTELLVPEGR